MAVRFSLLSICTIVGLVVPSGAEKFLQANPDLKDSRVLAEEVRQSLFSELAGAFGQRALDRIQAAIRPTYASLPKDEHGNLGREAVRYALHRYFVQRHGWYVKGLRPSDGAWNSTSPDAIIKHRVPAYMYDLFEQRLGRHGFGMHELVVFAATLEDLIRQEAVKKIEVAYQTLRVNMTDRVNPKIVDIILDAYMMTYITGANLSKITPGRFRAAEKRVAEVYPSWPQTKLWLRDMRKSIDHTDRHRRNPFASGMAFADAVHVVEEIGDHFGPFQALECHSLKSALVAKEHQGSGRVRLSQFYTHSPDGQWDFSESVEYLRHLGVLDETDPRRMSVVIPNYVNSLTNCIAPSGFYSVCCRDECEDLLSHLEEQIAAPEAAAGRIAELVANLPSETVEAPRNLSATLLLRLEEIAEHHGGRVPLHGRLFSQWLHHAYPRECSFPQVTSTTEALTLHEWMKNVAHPAASQEEMRRHQDEALLVGDDLNMTAEAAAEEALPWTAVEELVVKRPETPKSTRAVLKGAVLLAALASAAVTGARALGAAATEGKVDRHFV